MFWLLNHFRRTGALVPAVTVLTGAGPPLAGKVVSAAQSRSFLLWRCSTGSHSLPPAVDGHAVGFWSCAVLNDVGVDILLRSSW